MSEDWQEVEELARCSLKRPVYAKQPPNAKGTERPKNQADKSRLSINEFNKEFTQKWVLRSRTFRSLHLYLLDHPLLSPLIDAWKGVYG